jgi:hypothetical protein
MLFVAHTGDAYCHKNRMHHLSERVPGRRVGPSNAIETLENETFSFNETLIERDLSRTVS